MKKLFALFIGLILSFTGSSQSCLPDGIEFNTQAQIDSFLVNYPNCTEIEGDVTISDYWIGNITNLSGLNVLTSIGGYLYIGDNGFLTNLIGLDNLTSIGGNLGFTSNDGLNSLTGLDNLISIGGDLSFQFNDFLINLTGLNNLNSIEGNIYIDDNSAMTSLTGLENSTSIGGTLYISGNDAMTSLTGLNNVTNIEENLLIQLNDALTSLSGLENVTSIGGFLYIEGNGNIISLTGLDNVTSIAGDINIFDNPSLTSLTGLDNIESDSINNIIIYGNPSLSTCDVQSICDYLASPNGTINIHDNATGCASQQEVLAACIIGLNENNRSDNFINIYPNPSNAQITIEMSPVLVNSQISIYNPSGMRLSTQEVLDRATVIDITGLPVGIYYVKLVSNSNVTVYKIAKTKFLR